jgi:hypothetical protein
MGTMEIGMVGLGRMGANMTSRLLSAGHGVVAFDRHPEKVQAVVAEGADGAASLAEMVDKLTPPRTIWLMVAAAGVDGTLAALTPLLGRDDTIIDGGNSHYREDIRRAAALARAGIRYVDVGTSGGGWGKERGYCLTIGGDGDVVERLDPIFAALAPSVEAAPRTPGRTGMPATAEHGYLRCGPNGAGHFVKMVHTRSRRSTRSTWYAGSTAGTARSPASRATRRSRRSPPWSSASRAGAGRARRSSSAPASACPSTRSQYFRFRVGPDVSALALGMRVKRPGEAMIGREGRASRVGGQCERHPALRAAAR